MGSPRGGRPPARTAFGCLLAQPLVAAAAEEASACADGGTCAVPTAGRGAFGPTAALQEPLSQDKGPPAQLRRGVQATLILAAVASAATAGAGFRYWRARRRRGR